MYTVGTSMPLAQRTKLFVTVGSLIVISVGGFLFALNEAHRTLVLTTDSIMYADTARHIAAGQGVTTGILELDSTVAPRPQTQWPPFYAMLMAPLVRAGMSSTDAGRYVSAASFSALMLLVGLLVMRLHPLAGVAAASAMLIVPGITKISAAVWADATYAVIVITLCWVGSAIVHRPSNLRSFMLGCLVGIGILTKYLGIILIGAAVVIQLLSALRHRRLYALVQHLGSTVFGITLFVAPLIWYSLAADRPIGGAVRTLSSQSFNDVLHDTWATLSRDLTAHWMLWALLILAVSSFGLLLSNTYRKRSLARSWSHQLVIPVAVLVVYLLGLMAARLLINTDRIHTRFLAPIYPLVMLCFIVLIDTGIKQFGARARAITLTLIAALSLGWAVKTYDFRIGPYAVPGSPSSRWAQQATTPRDLIIGDRAAEFAFRYGYTVVRLGKDPHDIKLTPEILSALVVRWHDSFDRILLAVTPGLDAERYGPYTAELSQHDPPNGLTVLEARPDQLVFLVDSAMAP